ncbi:MAG: RluA family pseudouridine synthase [Candidatus Colwellbacteria bacterium]|nr:RluA family pseudouridine synthase [Candidatus Colwellbacteria bacterium]
MDSPKVVYEDDNFIALNKPAGMLVHRARVARPANRRSAKNRGETEETIADYLVRAHPEVSGVGDDPDERPGIVHRLDRGTSGILLVAKNQPYFEYLKRLFQTRAIAKTYLALVRGVPRAKAGVVNKPISIQTGSVKRTVHRGKKTQEAVTEYKTLKTFRDSALVEARPLTGRTHQIRVHLASIGHPVVGDVLYGGRSARWTVSPPARQLLHAHTLTFPSAPGRTITLVADLPPEFDRALKALEEDR